MKLPLARRISASLATLVLALSLCNPLRSDVKGPMGFQKTVMDATLALYGVRGDYSRFLCTANVVDKVKRTSKNPAGYIILSAGHCVDNEPSDVTFSVSNQIGSALHPVLPLMARMDGQDDFSFFFYPSTEKYPVMTFGRESTENVGDEVINPNFTQGLVKQLGIGTIISQVMNEHSANGGCVLCIGRFLIHEQAGPGASGSAVYSEKTHKIIGIVVIGNSTGMGVEPISTIISGMSKPDQYAELHQPHGEDDDQ